MYVYMYEGRQGGICKVRGEVCFHGGWPVFTVV